MSLPRYEQAPFYRPYAEGLYGPRLGLSPCPPERWLEVDARYTEDLAYKHRTFAERPGAVLQALPGSAPACAELEAAIDAWARDYGVPLAPSPTAGDPSESAPLVQAGLRTAEDLCLMRPPEEPDGEYVLAAAFLAMPGGWRLSDKIGKAMPGVHAPVPGYAGKLADPVRRLFARLPEGTILQRANWHLTPFPDRWMLGDGIKAHWDGAAALDAERIIPALSVRVERQTLSRLPESGWIVFTIRTLIDPLERVLAVPQAEGLVRAVAAMQDETAQHLRLTRFRAPLLEALKKRGFSA